MADTHTDATTKLPGYGPKGVRSDGRPALERELRSRLPYGVGLRIHVGDISHEVTVILNHNFTGYSGTLEIRLREESLRVRGATAVAAAIVRAWDEWCAGRAPIGQFRRPLVI